MDTFTRNQFVNTLTQDWGTYVARFEQRSAAEQKAILEKQGYPSLGALLGHIMAWWQDGSAVVSRMLADPAVTNPGYDVDAFNAASVQRSQGFSDTEMIQQYEAQRKAMLKLLNDLSDAELEDKRINERLFYEIIGHAQEHAFSA